MKKLFSLLVLSVAHQCLIAQVSHNNSAEWKAAPSHLLTRWGKTVTAKGVLNEYPRPQLRRKEWENLNGLWDYKVVDSADKNVSPSFDGKILVPFPIESALSGVQKRVNPGQVLWYRRVINTKNVASNERTLIHFDAVDWKTTVFLNGIEIGSHTGGYESFSFDVTRYLKPGSNELVVKVVDPTDEGPNPHGKQVLHPGNIYYTPTTGIWQTVWLEHVPSTFISELVMTPDIDQGRLKISVAIGNPTTADSVGIAALFQGKIVGKAIHIENDNYEIRLSNPQLWSPEVPNLYDLQVTLYNKGKAKDRVGSYFGMRKVEIKADEKGVSRIYLNNKPYYNNGTLDQGFWPDGLYTAPTDEALEFDIAAIKAMGFNTIRKHIKVEPARWYYHADKIGMLVWQDFVNPPHYLPEGAKPNFEAEMKSTLHQLHNYPSIICWVLFNEQWGAYDQKRLTDYVRAADPSRILNAHSGEILYVNRTVAKTSQNPWEDSQIADIHSYPEPLYYKASGQKAWIIGEFGGIRVSSPGHQWDDLTSWGYKDIEASRFPEKYRSMVDTLLRFKQLGLCGSIYTQPFDVEGEENGLITYDREVIKIPIETIQKINTLLCDNHFSASSLKDVKLANIDVTDNESRYAEYIKKFNSGNRDSAFLRRLSLMAFNRHDDDYATKVGNAFIQEMRIPLSKDNIAYIMYITRSNKDVGFTILVKDSSFVNGLMGGNTVKTFIQGVIYRDLIEKDVKGKNTHPNWMGIEKKVSDKYGHLGDEIYLMARAIDYYNKEDWSNYLKAVMPWLSKYRNNVGNFWMNNYCWAIFLYSKDTSDLNSALHWQEEIVKAESAKPNPETLDTYSNLLYKIGRKKEAISWEEKAEQLAAEKIRSAYTKTISKMKSNLPTWIE